MKSKITVKGKLDTIKLGKEISRELFPMLSLKGKNHKSKKQYNRKENKKIDSEE